MSSEIPFTVNLYKNVQQVSWDPIHSQFKENCLEGHLRPLTKSQVSLKKSRRLLAAGYS